MIITDSDRYQSIVLHVGGLTVAMTGCGIMASAVVDVIMGGPDAVSMAGCGFLTALVGYYAWRLTEVPAKLRTVDVFAVVVVAWLLLGVFGGIPYLVTGTLTRPDDALFEAVSGFTTTGATVLRPIEGNGPGIMFWRALSQWIGGMGVIVLVVAVLPSVGAGGMDLLSAEAPGPSGERLTPKVRHTARRLWAVYGLLTIAVIAGFVLGGMSLYDAVAHSFTTVSTGGFSPYNASLGHFESAFIEWVAIVGMFLAGGSFTLYYRALRGSLGPLLRSIEFGLYSTAVLVSTAAVYVINGPEYGYGHEAIRGSFFTIISIVSTTGFGTVDFEQWAEAARVIILFLMPIGAMAGSTAGGVKYMRVLAVASHTWREIQKQIHPRLVKPVRVGKSIVNEETAARMNGFVAIGLVVFAGGVISIALTGEDLWTSMSASATAFGNVGPGLADVGPTDDFRNLVPPARWVVIAQMLLGRLEIYPLILAFGAVPRSFPPARWLRLRK